MAQTSLKTSDARWDLSILYASIDDPQIDRDVRDLTERMKAFKAAYKGKLAEHLGEALQSYAGIAELENKVAIYLYLTQSLDTGNSAVKTKVARVGCELAGATGECLEFFDIEIASIPEDVLETAMRDPYAKKHRPMLDQIRILKPFMLPEIVESALTKREPFGPSAWSEFFDELEADLEFECAGAKKTLPEMLHILSESSDSSARARALKTINDGLAGTFSKYSAETLYMIVGKTAVERKERGYAHPMHGRNLSNRIPDAVSDALHTAVLAAAPLIQRFYRLKAAHLGIKKLRWSDRNAPMPFRDTTVVPFDEALKIVEHAYQSFSPTLSALVRECVQNKRIDAPMVKGKRGGAFNYSAVLPGGKPASWVLLNYLGSNRDVMTLAHELGHSVHGLLAGEAQGVLMYQAPVAYCETASVFGEMVTFDYLKQRLLDEGNAEAYLALVMGKIDDVINTTVRQIGFSNFERQAHGMNQTYTKWEEPRKRSPKELTELWQSTLRELYGDVFTYENTEHLYSYVNHLFMGFYVYGYAFGELLTHSLYAKRTAFGEQFEPLYLDLLKSGATKDAIELMRPFGLDPTGTAFWRDGIEISIGALLAEAEKLSRDRGVSI